MTIVAQPFILLVLSAFQEVQSPDHASLPCGRSKLDGQLHRRMSVLDVGLNSMVFN